MPQRHKVYERAKQPFRRAFNAAKRCRRKYTQAPLAPPLGTRIANKCDRNPLGFLINRNPRIMVVLLGAASSDALLCFESSHILNIKKDFEGSHVLIRKQKKG